MASRNANIIEKWRIIQDSLLFEAESKQYKLLIIQDAKIAGFTFNISRGYLKQLL